MRFRVVSQAKFDSELTPTLIFPDSRHPSLARASFPLQNGADFRFASPIGDERDLRLTFQFPDVTHDWGDKPFIPRRGPTEISLMASGPFEETSEFEVAIVNPFQIELQLARSLSEKCLVRCYDGTSGSPCVVCEKNGRSVRFCC